MSVALVAVLVLVAALLWPGSPRRIRTFERTVGLDELTARDHRASQEDGARAGPSVGRLDGARPEIPVEDRRSEVPLAELADAVDLLVLALRSGSGVIEALEAVGHRTGGLLGHHLLVVSAAQRWGVDEARSWATVDEAWRPVAAALAMAGRGGVPPAELLERAAEELRRAERARLEEATGALGVRVVLPLGLTFLPAFVLTTVLPMVLALAQEVLVGG